MWRPTIAQAIFGGLFGVVAMALMLYYAPLIGWPRVDYAAMLGHKGVWDLGLFLELTLGTVVFPLILSFLLWDVLPGPAIVKGLEWAFVLWLVSEIIFQPLSGGGFFSSRIHPQILTVVWTFFAHMVYGGILGAACAQYFYELVPGIPDKYVRRSGRLRHAR